MIAALRRAGGMLLSSRGLLLGAVAGASVAGTAFLGGGSSHTVTAYFTFASGLVKGNEIRVGGLIAGSVQSVEIAPDPKGGADDAVAVLEVDDRYWPLHQGTTFAIRPKGVLSNVYVSMQPGGARGAVVPDGHVFLTDQTSSPVTLDQFADIFSKDVTSALRTQIQEGAIAFGGDGAPNLNATIHNTNPLSADLDPVTSVLAQRTPELDRLNAEFDTISGDLSREDSNLHGLIQNGDTLLGALAAKETALQGTLDHAANTLADIDAGLRGQEGNLAAIFQKGPAALDKQRQMAVLFNPLISAVNPHISSLNDLIHYFLSATGMAPDPTTGRPYPVAVSRIDASVGSSAKNPSPCGGEPTEQGNCSGGSAGGGSGSGGSGSGGSGGLLPGVPGGSGAPSAPGGGSIPSVPSLFGGLFG